jgi:hypothetical protein
MWEWGGGSEREGGWMTIRMARGGRGKGSRSRELVEDDIDKE